MATSHQFDKLVHTIGEVQYVEELHCPQCQKNNVLMFGLDYKLLQICPDCEYTIRRFPILDDEGQDYPGHVLSSVPGHYEDALEELAHYNIGLGLHGEPFLIEPDR